MKAVNILYRAAGILRDLIFILASVFILSAAVCFVLQIKPAIVTSGSMEPEIHVGSVVFIDKKDREPDVGKIIAFTTETGTFVTHRIERITPLGIITKGDANDAQDVWVVKPADIVGTTMFSVPKAGYAIAKLKTRGGIIFIICIASALIIAAIFSNINAKKTGEKATKGKLYES